MLELFSPSSLKERRNPGAARNKMKNPLQYILHSDLLIIIIIIYISSQTQFKDTAANSTIIVNLLIAIGLVVFQPYTVNRQAVQIAFIEFVDGYSWLQDEGSNKPIGMRMFTDGMRIRNQSKLLPI